MITNFFRIELPFESFQIQQLPYSQEDWDRLKSAHNKQASFFRNEESMFISPAKEVELEIGELVTLDVVKSPGVVLSLIRHLVFRTFRAEFSNRVPLGFSPLQFLSTKPEHDVVRKFLPDELKDVIGFRRLIEVETRQIEENGVPSFGLLIRSRQRWQFDKTLQDLRDEGFDLVGCGVLTAHEIPGLEGVLAPEEELLGEVQSVEGENATIATNDGPVSRPLNSLSLQRNQSQIGSYLEFKLGPERATQIFGNLRTDRLDQGRPNVAFAEVQRFSSWFVGKKSEPRLYENNDGFCFTVTPDNRFSGVSVALPKTNLVFDYGPGASATTPFWGLANHGPFNCAKFASNDFRILAICHHHSRGAMSKFVKQLSDGIPESDKFKRGLQSLFRLNSVNATIAETDSLTPEAFEKAIDEAIASSDNPGFDLVLIECPEGSKQTPVCENPYYRGRVRAMSYGIPTQGVRDGHLRLPLDQLQWTLGPIALQIYAKAGGTPWRLPASQSVDREIVVGVGNSLERPNLWSGAEQSRVVGITTFFLGDGSYLIGERLTSVPYEEYFDELLSSLKNSLEDVAQRYAWKEGDSVRIVFHIFKPIKNIEADVVAELVDSFPQFNILFAFVTIATHHPWMLFRDASFRSGKCTITLCERGDNLLLDSRSCLLQLRGDRDRPNRRQRPPYPVLIRIHEKSTFRDLKYIAQQILDFSYLSWRSFFPCFIPVTVFYSNLIAAETSKLSQVPDWQPGFLAKHFRRKQWFL